MGRAGAITLEQTASPSQPGTATAIEAVEIRETRPDEAAAMGTIPSVAVVTLTGEAQDGFLRVIHNGQEAGRTPPTLRWRTIRRTQRSCKHKRPRPRLKPRAQHSLQHRTGLPGSG